MGAGLAPTTAASRGHPVAVAMAWPAVMVSQETRLSLPARCSTTTRIVSDIMIPWRTVSSGAVPCGTRSYLDLTQDLRPGLTNAALRAGSLARLQRHYSQIFLPRCARLFSRGGCPYM